MRAGLLLLGWCWTSSLAAVVLENGALRIEFGPEEGGFQVERIVNKLAGDVAFGADKPTFFRFWRLKFTAKDCGTNAVAYVTNRRRAESRTVKIDKDVATFRWCGVDLVEEKGVLDVDARVALKEDPRLSEWTLQVRNRSKKWTLDSTIYPALTRLVPEDAADVKVLVPHKNMGGALYNLEDFRKDSVGRYFRYPGCRLPLAAVMRGEAGLYFAAQDPACRDKTLWLYKDATAWVETTVENAGVNEAAAEGPRFPVTVGVFKGDWWEAAHIYRDWALKQKWAAKGPIARRADFPKRAAETQIWIIGGGRTNDAARCFAGMDRCWPDVGKALTWSVWTEASGGRATNRGNPEFFPALPGIGDLARKEAAAGFLVFPYVNARIWDVSNAGFAYAVREAAKKSDGRIHEEKYRDDYGVWNRFAVMCPHCPIWRETVTRLAVRCLDELGMNGVYFDQVSCSPAQPCHDATHGHPLGGGAWWADGYRRMFTEIKREFVRRDAAIVSEQLGEMWLDLIDVYLNATKYEPHDVPLFPAVYQGYCIHYGRSVPLDLPAREAFREHARTLVWGEAFGWISPGVPMYASYAERQKLLYDLACFRREHADFLVYGSLEGDLVVEGAADPYVFGTVWKDVDGARRCAFAVNASGTERDMKVRWPGETTAREVKLPPRAVEQIPF